MSENHSYNLIEKLASFEEQLTEAKTARDKAKYLLQEAVKQNMKLREINLLEECLDSANNKVNHMHSVILSLRRRIKRNS